MRLLRCQRGDVPHEDSVDASSFLFVARQCQGSEGARHGTDIFRQAAGADRKESNGSD